jgi:3'(2'), 5'-bisphosphate nucleotidase
LTTYDAEHEAAHRIATEAGRFLLDLRARLLADGMDPAAVKEAGDAGSNERILASLAEAFPDDVVLSEESADDPRRLAADRVWIVDPLDGTREYSEGRADWAVHVAFWADGELRGGAVALPGLDLTLSTEERLQPAERHDGPPRLLVSRTRPPQLAEELQRLLGAELVPMGSAGAKAMAVLRGEGDVYAHGGGQYEWDSAAPVAVAHAAGLHTSRLDGSPLVYNQEDVWLPDLLVCRTELAADVLEAIDSLA